jgi:hypothetical protein
MSKVARSNSSFIKRDERVPLPGLNSSPEISRARNLSAL